MSEGELKDQRCRYCDCGGPLGECPSCASHVCEKCLRLAANGRMLCVDCAIEVPASLLSQDDRYEVPLFDSSFAVVETENGGLKTLSNIRSYKPTITCRKAFHEFVERIQALPITELQTLLAPLRSKTEFAKALLMYRMELQSVVEAEITRREAQSRKAAKARLAERQREAAKQQSKAKKFREKKLNYLQTLANAILEAGLGAVSLKDLQDLLDKRKQIKLEAPIHVTQPFAAKPETPLAVGIPDTQDHKA